MYIYSHVLLLKILREASLLAKISHPHIVSYKTAWTEPCSTRRKNEQRKNKSPGWVPLQAVARPPRGLYKLPAPRTLLGIGTSSTAPIALSSTQACFSLLANRLGHHPSFPFHKILTKEKNKRDENRWS